MSPINKSGKYLANGPLSGLCKRHEQGEGKEEGNEDKGRELSDSDRVTLVGKYLLAYSYTKVLFNSIIVFYSWFTPLTAPAGSINFIFSYTYKLCLV